MLKLLRGREAGRPQATEKPPLPLVQELPLERVRTREALRGHHPLEIVRPHPRGRGRGTEPGSQVKWSGRWPVTRQRRGWNVDVSKLRILDTVATITSTWKPRVLHHQRCGRCGIRMHVKVGVSVGRDLKTVSCLLENFRYLTFLPLG